MPPRNDSQRRGHHGDDRVLQGCPGGIVKQQFGRGLVAAVGNGTARGAPREQSFFHFDNALSNTRSRTGMPRLNAKTFSLILNYLI
jgi:hypothetical protein